MMSRLRPAEIKVVETMTFMRVSLINIPEEECAYGQEAQARK